MARQITRKEYDKLQKELAYLKKEGRDEIKERLQEARAHGDLSENAEYDEARNDQAKLEENIAQLEKELDSVEVISDEDFKKGVVHIGSQVEIDDNGSIIKCLIGSSSEDPELISVSDDSPVGKAIMGKKAGQKFEVELPSGEKVTMKVLSTKDSHN